MRIACSLRTWTMIRSPSRECFPARRGRTTGSITVHVCEIRSLILSEKLGGCEILRPRTGNSRRTSLGNTDRYRRSRGGAMPWPHWTIGRVRIHSRAARPSTRVSSLVSRVSGRDALGSIPRSYAFQPSVTRYLMPRKHEAPVSRSSWTGSCVEPSLHEPT